MKKQILREMKKLDSASASSDGEAPQLHPSLSLTSQPPTQQLELHQDGSFLAEMVKGFSTELYSSPLFASSTENEPTVQDEDLVYQTEGNEVSSQIPTEELQLHHDVNEDSAERDTTEPTDDDPLKKIAKGLISREISIHKTPITDLEAILTEVEKLMDETEDKEKQCSRVDFGSHCKYTKDGANKWCRFHQLSSQYGKLKSKEVVTEESEQTPSEQTPLVAKMSATYIVLGQVYRKLNKAMAKIKKLNENLKRVEVPISTETGVEELQKMGEVYGALAKECVNMAKVQLEIQENRNSLRAAETECLRAAETENRPSESAGN